MPFTLKNATTVCKIIVLCIALVVITLSLYIQVRNHEFISYDDGKYVSDNQHVARGLTANNIVWAFTTVYASNWHPITWLSHMADVHLYGMDPGGHHLTNVGIHSLSSLILLLLLFRVTGSLWQSSFVAAMFALHPLHVESVAWVAERKDVISTLFLFITLFLYSEYVVKRKLTLYILTLFSFVLGLMSKPMLVTLPIILLLMDYWPLGRYQHEKQERGLHQHSVRVVAFIKEKIPFFICSLLSGIITTYAQGKGGAIGMIPFQQRIENALIAYLKYIFKALWPIDLAVLYPLSPSFPLWQVISSLLVLLLVSAAAIWFGRRYPYLAVGWFWFLITLIPVIGLIQVGVQSMADRYTYIPLIGIFIITAWGVSDLTRSLQYREVIISVIAGAIIISSAVLTHKQVGYWRDSVSLYQHAIQVTTGNYVMHGNLGDILHKNGNLDAAIQEYQKALSIRPDYIIARKNLGLAFLDKGNFDLALQEYQEAIQINPYDIDVLGNIGHALYKVGHLDSAIQVLEEVLRINPNHVQALNTLGMAVFDKSVQD